MGHDALKTEFQKYVKQHDRISTTAHSDKYSVIVNE
jgi:hypothetical protein